MYVYIIYICICTYAENMAKIDSDAKNVELDFKSSKLDIRFQELDEESASEVGGLEVKVIDGRNEARVKRKSLEVFRLMVRTAELELEKTELGIIYIYIYI
jgi:hypothetical protein